MVPFRPRVKFDPKRPVGVGPPRGGTTDFDTGPGAASASIELDERLTQHGPVRCSVLVAINPAIRCVRFDTISLDPPGVWMRPVTRDRTDVVDGFFGEVAIESSKALLIANLAIPLPS